MKLYTGYGKKLRVNFNGKIYKIMDVEADLTKAYVALINSNEKTLDDVPEPIKEAVEAQLKSSN